MSEIAAGKLRYRVSCECGDSHEGEATTYPEAWKAMDEWKQPHNWGKHPARSKPFDHYSWRESVEVVGDRTPYDVLPAPDPAFRSRLFPELREQGA